MFNRLAGAPPADLDLGQPAEDAADTGPDSGFFGTAFQDDLDGERRLVTWSERGPQVRAESLDPAAGAERFARLWGEDRHFAKLSPADLLRMSGYLQFVRVPAHQEVIGQNEEGDYLLIVLDGSLAVDRIQPWGGRARIAEAHVGDMLGEMSLLDAGARFSACTTLSVAQLAVLEARQLDAMMERDPALALALLASLSRRLSLRLRQVSARLSALLTRA